MNPRDLIQKLNLHPHPEGGFYRETFRSANTLARPGGSRHASTAIYYLLLPNSFSAFHRVASDEVWHHYAGDPIELHTLLPSDRHRKVILGPDILAGEHPQCVVEADTRQAARPARTDAGYSLCGCTVAPGFDFSDFTLGTREVLTRLFPSYAQLVQELTR